MLTKKTGDMGPRENFSFLEFVSKILVKNAQVDIERLPSKLLEDYRTKDNVKEYLKPKEDKNIVIGDVVSLKEDSPLVPIQSEIATTVKNNNNEEVDDVKEPIVETEIDKEDADVITDGGKESASLKIPENKSDDEENVDKFCSCCNLLKAHCISSENQTILANDQISGSQDKKSTKPSLEEDQEKSNDLKAKSDDRYTFHDTEEDDSIPLHLNEKQEKSGGQEKSKKQKITKGNKKKRKRNGGDSSQQSKIAKRILVVENEEETLSRITQELPKHNWLEQKIKNHNSIVSVSNHPVTSTLSTPSASTTLSSTPPLTSPQSCPPVTSPISNSPRIEPTSNSPVAVPSAGNTDEAPPAEDIAEEIVVTDEQVKEEAEDCLIISEHNTGYKQEEPRIDQDEDNNEIEELAVDLTVSKTVSEASEQPAPSEVAVEEVEVIDPINYMQENLWKKINQNQSVTLPSSSALTYAPQISPLPPSNAPLQLPTANNWPRGSPSMRVSDNIMGSPPPQRLTPQQQTPVINIKEKLQVENELAEARSELNKIKSDLDDLKNKKIKEMEELLDLKSQKENTKTELETLKLELLKQKSFLFSVQKENSVGSNRLVPTNSPMLPSSSAPEPVHHRQMRSPNQSPKQQQLQLFSPQHHQQQQQQQRPQLMQGPASTATFPQRWEPSAASTVTTSMIQQPNLVVQAHHQNRMNPIQQQRPHHIAQTQQQNMFPQLNINNNNRMSRPQQQHVTISPRYLPQAQASTNIQSPSAGPKETQNPFKDRDQIPEIPIRQQPNPSGRNQNRSSPMKTCVVCQNLANFLCSGCQRIHYCTVKCQSLHWSTHFADCRNLRNQQK